MLGLVKSLIAVVTPLNTNVSFSSNTSVGETGVIILSPRTISITVVCCGGGGGGGGVTMFTGISSSSRRSASKFNA